MPPRYIALIAAVAISCTAYAIQPDPIFRETILRQARPRVAGEKFDSQESDPRLRGAFAAADAAAERHVANVKRDEKFICKFWAAKKQILRKQFGVIWKSPADLNPTLAYDLYGLPRLNALEVRAVTSVVRKHFRNPSEKITTIERNFEGTVEVATVLEGTEVARTYWLRGHDRHWAFLDSKVVLP
jgi:hypothetical protein